MGVVSNKINIIELMKRGGGGDPTIPGRVSALETETAGLIEANAKIMTSVSALAEANAKVMTSVSNMKTVMDRLNGYEFMELETIELSTKDATTETYPDTLTGCITAIKAAFIDFCNNIPDDIVYVPMGTCNFSRLTINNIVRPLSAAVETGIKSIIRKPPVDDFVSLPSPCKGAKLVRGTNETTMTWQFCDIEYTVRTSVTTPSIHLYTGNAYNSMSAVNNNTSGNYFHGISFPCMKYKKIAL